MKITASLLALAGILLVVNWSQYIWCLFNRVRFKSRRLRILTVLSLSIMLTYLLTHSLVRGHAPFTTRPEIFALFSSSIIGVYLGLSLVHEIKAMGSLVIPTSLLFLGLAMWQEFTPIPAESSNPLLGNFGLWIHIFLIVTAYGTFTVSFLLAVGYLRAESQLRSKTVDEYFFMFPSLEALDNGLQKCIWIGVACLLFGILIAFLAGITEGDISINWIFDPNIAGTLITGLTYSTILYIRRRSLFTNRKIAYLAIFGFLFIVLMFFGMNYFPKMHQFA